MAESFVDEKEYQERLKHAPEAFRTRARYAASLLATVAAAAVFGLVFKEDGTSLSRPAQWTAFGGTTLLVLGLIVFFAASLYAPKTIKKKEGVPELQVLVNRLSLMQLFGSVLASLGFLAFVAVIAVSAAEKPTLVKVSARLDATGQAQVSRICGGMPAKETSGTVVGEVRRNILESLVTASESSIGQYVRITVASADCRGRSGPDVVIYFPTSDLLSFIEVR